MDDSGAAGEFRAALPPILLLTTIFFFNFLGWMGDAGAFGRALMLIGALTILASRLTVGRPRS